MDNLFITRHFDWSYHPRWQIRLFNSLLVRLGYSAQLVTRAASGKMSSVEQRINMYHLVAQSLLLGVPGDIVEFGSLTGQSAALLRMTADQYDPARSLHVFDAFVDPPVECLIENFRHLDLALPVIHQGLLADTLHELSESICFAYIDLGPVPSARRGPGASHAGLGDAIRLVLEHVYPRVSAGGIVVLEDYRPPGPSDKLYRNPQVREAAEAFFADKPESIVALYGGAYDHGFVRKLSP